MNPEKEATLKVNGMTCGHCVRHVTEALRNLDGVRAVDVNLSQGIAKVRYSTDRVSEAAMVKVLDEAGYDAGALPGG